MTVPRMTRNQRRWLVKVGKKNRDADTVLRFLAVAKLAAGKSRREIAKELEVAVSTVVRAGQRFCEKGLDGLYDGRRANGKSKVDTEFLRKLERILRRTPDVFGWQRPTWTRELLCKQMELEGFPSVAVCTMGRALARIGARLGTPKPVVACPWKRDARDARLREIKALEAAASAAQPVLYSDEVDIHLNPKIGRDWMPKGYQRKVLTRPEQEVLLGGCAGRSDRTAARHGCLQQKRGAVLPDVGLARCPVSES